MLLTLLCWFAIIFFFAATVRKFMDYAKKPMHGRQDLYPIPGEPEEKAEHGGSYFEDQKWWEQPRKKNHVGEIVDMLKEMLFIKKLFVKQRKFWWISYARHHRYAGCCNSRHHPAILRYPRRVGVSCSHRARSGIWLAHLLRYGRSARKTSY